MQSLRQKAKHPYKGGEISPGSRLHTAGGSNLEIKQGSQYICQRDLITISWASLP